MDYIKSYEEHNINEGLKENIMIGILSLFGLTSFGQSKLKQDEFKHFKTKNEFVVNRLLSKGWTLDSVEIKKIWDTIKVNKPYNIVKSMTLLLDSNMYFSSGSFKLSDMMKDAIDSTMNEIKHDGGFIGKIIITSSTDKQPVGKKLKDILIKNGYEGTNVGLSKARNDAALEYLKNKYNIDENIVTQNINHEEGEKEIDEKSRYVLIEFVYTTNYIESKEEYILTNKEVKTYFLSKKNDSTTKTPNRKKMRFGYKINKTIGKIGNFKIENYNTTKCWI